MEALRHDSVQQNGPQSLSPIVRANKNVEQRVGLPLRGAEGLTRGPTNWTPLDFRDGPYQEF